MAGTLGYLPSLKAAVLFGGVARRNGGQLTDTFVLRNETWQSVAGEHPPAVGPFVYDTTRETLVTLLVTGETWSFDGFRWRELPVVPPTTTTRGPIAWDPLQERLVALLGTQTWVLDNNDAWRQLDGDSPTARCVASRITTATRPPTAPCSPLTASTVTSSPGACKTVPARCTRSQTTSGPASPTRLR